MDTLKNFDLEHWWKLVAAAGALITIASVPVQFTPGLLTGLGLLFFGVGEWVNHPIQVKLGQGFKITGYPWRPYFFGIVLDVIGTALLGFGLYRVAFTP